MTKEKIRIVCSECGEPFEHKCQIKINRTWLEIWAERLANNFSHSSIQIKWELEKMLKELKMKFEK